MAPGADELESEAEIVPPAGVRLEHPEGGGIQVYVTVTRGRRAILMLPRMVFVVGLAFTIQHAWRHHVFFAFWFIGLSFVRWLFGAARTSILINDRTIRVDGMRWFGSALILQRNEIKELAITRGSAFEVFQRVLVARLVDQRTATLLVGASAEQAEFVNGGLQRWLAGAG